MSEYIGERYVPQHEGAWDTSKPYDRLSIVTVTTPDPAGDMVDSYISRQPVPVGIEISNPDYWALLYISRITSGGAVSVSWPDIENKPDTFPPSAHTQGWDTITGKPTTFPPDAHTQNISTINGLTTTLTDLQTQIDGIGTSGTDITSAVFALRQTVNITSSGAQLIPFNTLVRSANPGTASWSVTSGGVATLTGIGASTYDIYLSGSMYVTNFSTNTSARTLTIRTASSSVIATFYVDHGIKQHVLPDTLIGTVDSSNNTTFSVWGQFVTGDSFGLTATTITRDFLTLKAIRRG